MKSTKIESKNFLSYCGAIYELNIFKAIFHTSKEQNIEKSLSFSCQNSIFFLFLPPFSQNVDIVIESKWLQPYTKQTYHIGEQHTHFNKHSLQLGHWAQSKEEQTSNIYEDASGYPFQCCQLYMNFFQNCQTLTKIKDACPFLGVKIFKFFGFQNSLILHFRLGHFSSVRMKI